MAKNILMLLMKLEIGGAETHVAELSKELKNQGYNIVVASAGGVYEKFLEDEGIKHYTVPLQNKNPKNVIKAFSMIEKIIKDENIYLVHSHARIPSFIAGKICRKLKVPFVTTAHWVFTTKYGLKYITDWGEKTIAVSEDIKKYLMDNYKLPEENIRVTINGIDTEKFSPKTDKKKAMEEFGISDSDNTIVYVSRMDKDRSLVAHLLIDAVKSLDNIIENLKVIIVGDGDDYDEVAKKAQEANKELAREVFSLAGARTDINTIVAPAKLFVGVSRAALEAMAAGKPTIIAGNEGYIGLFTQEKVDISYQTNFCCRGCDQSKSEKLSQDIANFFGMWDEDKEKIREFSRDFVIKNYSLKRMAEDAKAIYDNFLK